MSPQILIIPLLIQIGWMKFHRILKLLKDQFGNPFLFTENLQERKRIQKWISGIWLMSKPIFKRAGKKDYLSGFGEIFLFLIPGFFG